MERQVRFNMSITLREVVADDLLGISGLANNWAIAQHTSDRFPYPYALEDAQTFLKVVQAASAAGDPPTFAIDLAGKAIGCCGAFHPPGHDTTKRGTLLVGYWIGQPYWGKGYASSALQQLISTLLLAPAYASIRRLEAHVHAGNVASRRVLEKSGFQLEGTLREASIKRAGPHAGEGEVTVHDLCIYGLLRSDRVGGHVPTT